MHVVVVADGSAEPGDERELASADLVVAADGGARLTERLGRRPDVVVGDLDSLPGAEVARVESAGVGVERHPTDKEASDTELAVAHAVAAGADRVTLVGALGGRLDHEVANLLLLADPRWRGIELRIVRGAAVARAVHAGARLELAGPLGGGVTLLPVAGDATGVTTGGLRWQLNHATLDLGRSRGLSNVVTDAPAWVGLDGGVLLVIEHHPGGPI